MAKAEKYYAASVLEELSGILGGICEEQRSPDGRPIGTVYTSRPSAVPNHKEFIVVSLSKSMYSHGPYQNAAVYMDIYVKNGQGGIARVNRLQQLTDSITELGSVVRSRYPEDAPVKRWYITKPKMVLEGDDNLGFSVWRVRWKLFVNTTDKYYLENNN